MDELGPWDERTFADIVAVRGRTRPDRSAVIDAHGRPRYRGFTDQPAYHAATSDAERCLHSGDVGRFDERSSIRIVGRTEDMILRGGTSILPAEIEHLESRHPDMADVAVADLPEELVLVATLPTETVHPAPEGIA